MIDYNMAFRTEALAKADPVVGKYYVNGRWDPTRCNFNTLIWDPADDTITTIQGPDGPVKQVTHNPIDTQFRLTICLSPPADPNLINHKQLELAIDHVTGTVLQTSFTNPQLGSLRIQPVFLGSKYPFQ